MRKLMGYLSQYASFSKQGELLCTQSLGYLLLNNGAQNAFLGFLSKALDTKFHDHLTWRTEYCQSDGGRPDLEGCRLDGAPIVKVEGKLDASFGKGQLVSYMNELCSLKTNVGGLAVLVPQNREIEATQHVVDQFRLEGEGPWQYKNVAVAVITWERLFGAFEKVEDKEFQEDLLQLHSMYRALNGDDMEPLTTDEEVLSWREKEDWWGKLVDLTTRKLTPAESKLYPLGNDKSRNPYFRRYVPGKIDGSYYSIGTQDPFEGYTTPIWLRFHKVTGQFQSIAQSLEHSSIASNIVRSGRHLWCPLEVPYNSDREQMVSALVEQTNEILEIAYRFSP